MLYGYVQYGSKAKYICEFPGVNMPANKINLQMGTGKGSDFCHSQTVGMNVWTLPVLLQAS